MQVPRAGFASHRVLTAASVALVALLGVPAGALSSSRPFDARDSRSRTTIAFAVVPPGRVAAQAREFGKCPQGSWTSRIESVSGHPLGLAHLCGLRIRKLVADGRDPSRIESIVRETDALPGGTIVLGETQTISFGPTGKESAVAATGTMIRGTGRYAGVSGTIVGRGTRVRSQVALLTTLSVR
jgi:hypothetical protein